MEEKSQLAAYYVDSSSTNKGLELYLVLKFCPFWKTGEGETFTHLCPSVYVFILGCAGSLLWHGGSCVLAHGLSGYSAGLVAPRHVGS